MKQSDTRCKVLAWALLQGWAGTLQGCRSYMLWAPLCLAHKPCLQESCKLCLQNRNEMSAGPQSDKLVYWSAVCICVCRKPLSATFLWDLCRSSCLKRGISWKTGFCSWMKWIIWVSEWFSVFEQIGCEVVSCLVPEWISWVNDSVYLS